MPRLSALCVAAAFALATAVRPAEAQRVLFSSSDGTTSTTAFLDLATSTVTTIGSDFSNGGVFTADGQFVVYRVVDVTRSESRIRHVASGLETALTLAFVPQMAHPRQLAVFGTVGDMLTRLDASGSRSWATCGPGVYVPFQLSEDGAQLFGVCPNGHLLAIDSDSGTILRDTVIGAAGSIQSFAASPDGSEVVVLRMVGTGLEVARLDAVSGTTLRARLSHPLAVSGRLYAVPGGKRFIESLYVLGTPGNSGADARLVDFATLGVFPQSLADRSPFDPRVVVSMDGREGYFGWTTFFGGVISSIVRRIDLTTGALLGTASAQSLSAVAVASLPHPVEAVTAAVSSRSVALSWRLPALSPAATGYRLAIGTAPGATDLGSIALGPAESFTAAAVPSGRYYVRVHTVNATGTSGPSAEIVVDVP